MADVIPISFVITWASLRIEERRRRGTITLHQGALLLVSTWLKNILGLTWTTSTNHKLKASAYLLGFLVWNCDPIPCEPVALQGLIVKEKSSMEMTNEPRVPSSVPLCLRVFLALWGAKRELVPICPDNHGKTRVRETERERESAPLFREVIVNPRESRKRVPQSQVTHTLQGWNTIGRAHEIVSPRDENKDLTRGKGRGCLVPLLSKASSTPVSRKVPRSRREKCNGCDRVCSKVCAVVNVDQTNFVRLKTCQRQNPSLIWGQIRVLFKGIEGCHVDHQTLSQGQLNLVYGNCWNTLEFMTCSSSPRIRSWVMKYFLPGSG